MKLRMKFGNLELETEGETHKEIFREISKGWLEVFAPENCGICKSPNIRLRVRNVEDKKKKKFEYFEKVCLKCNAKLAMGQHLENGSLFPKRKIEKNGVESYDSEHHGWSKYQAPKEEAGTA